MIKSFYKPMTSPLGLMSIASYLNENGHEASICDRFFSNDDIEAVLNKYNPDIVGISVITNRFIDDACEISEKAKQFSVPVVWGGPMASEIPLEILESGMADYISFNEGEETWLEMAEALKNGESFDNIKGLGYISDKGYVKTPDREFIDLSKLPPLDWSLINPEAYFQPYYQSKKMLYMYSSKGCIGNCTFCYNAQFHHSKHRKRPYEHLFKEIKYLVENHGMDGINFSDDLMFCNKQQVHDFCNGLIENNINIFWGGNLRIGILNDIEDFKLLHKAGCRWLLIGVESGSKRMQKAMSKGIPFEKTVATFDKCNEVGIVSIAPFMIGLPNETPEDLKETVRVAKQLKATVCAFNFFTPIPGTKMYDTLVAEKKYDAPKNLKGYSEQFFGENLVHNVSEISSKELKMVWRYFQLRSLTFKSDFDEDEQNTELLFLKIFKNAIKSISGHGLIHFIQSGFKGVVDFLSTISIFLHPKIRKKYGLYFK